MSDDLVALIRRIVTEVLSTVPKPRHGIVQNVDPVGGTVRVAWDDEGTLSGHLPIAQFGVGNGWGMVCLPTPGTQVFCAPDSNDGGSMVVIGAVPSTLQPPGKITPYQATDAIPLVPGEPTFISASGASFRMTDGGVIEMRGSTLKVSGDLLVSGQISDLNGARGTLDLLRSDYDVHRHTGIVRGGGATDPTDHPTP